MPEDTPAHALIGARARAIRKHRGLPLDVAAGLTGISTGYLSRLERGKRQFTRRGLLEDLADALGCSIADLTGTPDVLPDRRILTASAAIPALMVAFHDTTLDDVPDVPHRPVPVLAELARQAAVAADEAHDPPRGTNLADLITELHVAAAVGPDRQLALEALVSASVAATYLAAALRQDELAVSAAQRGWDAARHAGRPDMIGMLIMERALTLTRIGARRRATGLVDATLAALANEAGPTREHTETAQARGMLHLTAGHLAAKDGRDSDLDTHMAEAVSLAKFTGERNHMNFHFGPAGVRAWGLAAAVETGTGPEVAEQVDEPTLLALASKDRRAAVHFDLARAYAQDDKGARDERALHHLDQADRIAPVRVRQDPLARELVSLLDRRAHRRAWLLNSMKNRVGIA